METLAYLHLALANEAPSDLDRSASLTLNLPHLSARATCSLLPLIALGVFGMATQASALVKEGDRGAEVRTLQERLQQLGYFKAQVTGYFGSLTKEAVIQFQQAKGLSPDGVVGENTSAALNGQRRVRSQPVSESSSRILRLGDRGEQVRLLQEGLAQAGFPSNNNGVFDAATQEAVERFQRSRGLLVDGIVGSQTLAALPAIGGAEPTPTLGDDRSQSDVKMLQRRLQAQGFYRGSIDGVWGPRTQAAVEAAQLAYGITEGDIRNSRF